MDAEILDPTGIRSPDRPVLSELLYRLRYPGTSEGDTTFILEQTKCSGMTKEVAVYFQCSGALVTNRTALDSNLNTGCRGECEISDIHVDSLFGRGLLPIGSCCVFCR